MASYSFERTVNMPIEKVWPLIGDFTKSPGPDISVQKLIDSVEKHHALK